MISARMRAISFYSEATVAFRSAIFPVKMCVQLHTGYEAGSSCICLIKPGSSKTPCELILNDPSAAPFCHNSVEFRGIEPGTIPPTTASCPRFATKKVISLGFSSSLSKTGVMVVISDKCAPPAIRWLAMITSPGLVPLSLVGDRCAHRAEMTRHMRHIATRPPSAANKAHK
jgi:hypothetical protein